MGQDWCPSCSSYLGLLRRKPRHIAKCVNITIALGLGFFLALGWQVFLPLTEGRPAGKPAGWFWCEFVLATVFVALGLRAREHLREMRRRALARGRGTQEAEAEARPRAARN